MNGNSLGKAFKVTSFGESHGKIVGITIDGCPAGLKLDEQDIQRELDRRKPGESEISTTRKEEDKVEILSGVFNGFTTGAPICMLTWNKDINSSKYELIKHTPRPGHADYTAKVKYGNFNDYRGGGRFSGRITAGFVMAGAVAKKLLKKVLNIELIAYVTEIGGIKSKKISLEKIRENKEKTLVRCGDLETAEKMEKLILQVKSQGDSIGGIIECQAVNLPIGLGEPVFDTLEGDLAKSLFAIPAVKGVEFGSGFEVSRMKGSECNDPFILKNGKILTKTNHAGGILGGISNGMPIVCRVAIKPTSSIDQPQKTVDLVGKKEVEIQVKGRHDPCIVPRAVPVVEAMVALVLVDHVIRQELIKRILKP